MNQSTLIGGALLAAFALFITSRSRLSSYGRILWGEKPDAHSTTTSTNESGGSQSISDALEAQMDAWTSDQLASLRAQIDEWAN